MDDDIRGGVPQLPGKARRIGDVPLRKVGDDKLMVGEFLLQGASKHPFAASDEYAHKSQYNEVAKPLVRKRRKNLSLFRSCVKWCHGMSQRVCRFKDICLGKCNGFTDEK